MSKCKAFRVSDQKVCHQCKLVWDVNDSDPPACRLKPVEAKDPKKIIWRTYERLTTGQMFKFHRVRPGVYKCETGLELNVVQLNKNYQFISANRKRPDPIVYSVSPNGFKNRVLKANQ